MNELENPLFEGIILSSKMLFWYFMKTSVFPSNKVSVECVQKRCMLRCMLSFVLYCAEY